MARQHLRETFAVTILVYFSMVMLLATQTVASPLKFSANGNVPWTNPCFPNGNFNSKTTQVHDMSIQALLDKLEESYYHSEYIAYSMESRLGDSRIVEYLKHKHLEGFPELAGSETGPEVNATKILIDDYEKLSRAAVFLEYIQHEEIDMDVRIELEDLFYGHLSIMCEIRYILSNSNIYPVYPVADRSIARKKLQRYKTRFWSYQNDMITIFKYLKLLHSMIFQYNNV